MKPILNRTVLLGCVVFAAIAFGQDALTEVAPAEASPMHTPEAALSPIWVDQDDPSDDVVAEPEEVVVTEDTSVVAAVSDAEEVVSVVVDTAVTADVRTAEELPRRSTRLGLMRLESLTGHDKLASELTAEMVEKLEALGLYEVYRPGDIDKALADAHIRRPGDCRDPLCVKGIAKALGLRRMIYGTVDMNGQRAAVTLTLVDVSLNRPVSNVSIEGAPGVPAGIVLQSAIERLHGHKSDIDVTKYHGPVVSNLKEFLWSTIAVQGAGLFYSVVNYGISGKDGSGIDYLPHSGKETLSGIPASSIHIPMFARPAALGNAYTAVSDDAYGVLYNPAGMPWVENGNAALGYQYRFGMDMLAASYANKAARDIGFGQALMLVTDRDNLMTELFFVTAAGYKYNRMPLLGPVSFGASLKMIGNTVNARSPDSPGGQSFGVGLDLGLMWELSDRIRYGLHVKDVMSVNRWRNRTTNTTYGEWSPATMHMGGSYNAGDNAFFVADGQIPLYADQPWVMAGGIEYILFRIFALRVGLQREIQDEEADWWKITGGCGIKFDIEPLWGNNLSLDFAYEYNTLELFPVFNVSIRVGF